RRARAGIVAGGPRPPPRRRRDRGAPPAGVPVRPPPARPPRGPPGRGPGRRPRPRGQGQGPRPRRLRGGPAQKNARLAPPGAPASRSPIVSIPFDLERLRPRSLNVLAALVSGQEARVALTRRPRAPAVVALGCRTLFLDPDRTNLYDLLLGARLLRRRAEG